MITEANDFMTNRTENLSIFDERHPMFDKNRPNPKKQQELQEKLAKQYFLETFYQSGNFSNADVYSF